MKRETVQTPLISENEKILEAAGTGWIKLRRFKVFLGSKILSYLIKR